ncbi:MULTISPECIES: HDOD domain-containing protein [Methylomonas]|uniref:HDOD domain-containing protein n=1 Tax=Methylomonas TaxID=416 RepID=UPI001232BB8C|nr:HDOD domain-containing protein [Methylomonas rhizoryzae]
MAFPGKFSKWHNLADKGAKVSPQILEQLFPVRNLSEEVRLSFAEENHMESIPAGATLFTIDTPTDSAIYLIKGSINFTDQNGRSYSIEAGSPKAKFPICSGNKHTTTAVTETEVSLLRVSLSIMSSCNRNQHQALEIPPKLSDNRLLALFADHYLNHELEIPSLPEVAIQIRKAIQADVNLDEIVKIVNLDPVISAKLVEVANCPLYIAQAPAKNCMDAIKRIGLNATRSMVVSLSLKQVFKSRSQPIKLRLEELWKKSLYLSTLCHILAKAGKEINPEDALLAGLVSDIGGIPFLNFVANLPNEFTKDKEISEALPIVTPVVGTTVLKEWQFAPEFIDVSLNSHNWYQNSGDNLSLTDIVVLSRLHTLIGNRALHDPLPAITSIPAAGKFKGIALSPENTLAILHDAKSKIHSALRLFLT